jgi:hypothetical protein
MYLIVASLSKRAGIILVETDTEARLLARYDAGVRWLSVVNAVLLVAVAGSVVGLEVIGRPEASVESSVRRYADAVGNTDLNAALAEIAPEQRPAWRDWINSQLGNIYEVRGIAVRAPSLLQRLRSGATSGPTEVTNVIDVDRAFPDQFYQATTRVPVQESGGSWFLGQPLLSDQ